MTTGQSKFRSALMAAACAMLTLTLAASAFAGDRTARFRSGTVISAELSSSKPQILNESQFEPYKDMKSVTWAEVVVKLDKGRSLGVADFALVCNEVEYKCLAIAEDNKPYNVAESVFPKTSSILYYRLLFPIKTPPSDRISSYSLRFKLLSSPPDINLKFRSMDNSSFTEVSKLPADGSLGISATELSIMRRAKPQ